MCPALTFGGVWTARVDSDGGVRRFLRIAGAELTRQRVPAVGQGDGLPAWLTRTFAHERGRRRQEGTGHTGRRIGRLSGRRVPPSWAGGEPGHRLDVIRLGKHVYRLDPVHRVT